MSDPYARYAEHFKVSRSKARQALLGAAYRTGNLNLDQYVDEAIAQNRRQNVDDGARA